MLELAAFVFAALDARLQAVFRDRQKTEARRSRVGRHLDMKQPGSPSIHCAVIVAFGVPAASRIAFKTAARSDPTMPGPRRRDLRRTRRKPPVRRVLLPAREHRVRERILPSLVIPVVHVLAELNDAPAWHGLRANELTQ